MTTVRIKLLLMSFLALTTISAIFAQDRVWTLNDCIDYGLSKNITIRKSVLSTKENAINLAQSKVNLFPMLSGSASTNYSWQKEILAEENSFGTRQRSNTASFGLDASATLFNGSRLRNKVKQAKINFRSSQYASEAEKESVQLSILEAYLEILYAQESVKNDRQQIQSTGEELNLAKERLDVGVISQSDYLEIKSELAFEKSTLADDLSSLETNRVILMQLMEFPVDNSFQIESPGIDDLLTSVQGTPEPSDVFHQALQIKPQIKEAELNLESAKLDEKIARAARYPTLTLNGGLSTGWSGQISGFSNSSQLKNQFTPSVGINLSIPIFSNFQGKNNLNLAKISTRSVELDEIDTKNILRKNIEQACVDLTTSRVKYEASMDAYQSANESYEVASEKYKQGLINSVDFLSVKTDLITAENELLQAKFNLVFSDKRLDFYKGIPISLSR